MYISVLFGWNYSIIARLRYIFNQVWWPLSLYYRRTRKHCDNAMQTPNTYVVLINGGDILVLTPTATATHITIATCTIYDAVCHNVCDCAAYVSQ